MTLQAALTGILERFETLELQDPGFRPHYHGQPGELTPHSIPMRVS